MRFMAVSAITTWRRTSRGQIGRKRFPLVCTCRCRRFPARTRPATRHSYISSPQPPARHQAGIADDPLLPGSSRRETLQALKREHCTSLDRARVTMEEKSWRPGGHAVRLTACPSYQMYMGVRPTRRNPAARSNSVENRLDPADVPAIAAV